ncbi:MAG: peroxide stress protein YaaA [Variovorax sp.]
MLFLLSPSKALDFETTTSALKTTAPVFGGTRGPAFELIEWMREKSAAEVASLMHLSDKLAALNVARYATWSPRATVRNAKAAALAFDGDVYGGLDAPSLSAAQLAWAQEHLCILSGLYGVLRPLDRLQPYRLEMGTQLATPGAGDLYEFWGERIAGYLNRRLAGTRAPVVVNLASQEYWKAVDRDVLEARVVECVFQEYKGGQYKIVSFFAKRARGLMARWAILRKAGTPRKLEGFDLEGYVFAPVVSEPDRLVFRRKRS